MLIAIDRQRSMQPPQLKQSSSLNQKINKIIQENKTNQAKQLNLKLETFDTNTAARNKTEFGW